MTWGFMSKAHIVSLVIAVVIIILFSIIVSKLSKKAQKIVLFIFSLCDGHVIYLKGGSPE